MAERVQQLYREHRVFAHDGEAAVVRVCFERLSDGLFAVAHTEFIREADDIPARVAEIGITTAELMVSPDQPDLWEFRPTLADAIAANDEAFADVKEWIKNAQD